VQTSVCEVLLQCFQRVGLFGMSNRTAARKSVAAVTMLIVVDTPRWAIRMEGRSGTRSVNTTAPAHHPKKIAFGPMPYGEAGATKRRPSASTRHVAGRRRADRVRRT
jgi:hypothetical protein